MKPKSKMLMQLKDEVVSEVEKQPTPTNSRLNQAKRMSSLMKDPHLMIDEGD